MVFFFYLIIMGAMFAIADYMPHKILEYVFNFLGWCVIFDGFFLGILKKHILMPLYLIGIST